MKEFKVLIAPEAFADIQEAVSWYEEQQEGLGQRFKEATIRTIDFVALNPFAYTIRYNKVRCALVKRFPFMIHYIIVNKDHLIKILAIISTSRNPKIWRKKTGD